MEKNKGSSSRASDQLVAIANVTRIMRRGIPAHGKIADDAKEAVQHCVSQFIRLVTSEANLHCQSECRKTITSDDILRAMARLGFDNYAHALSLYMSRYREAEAMGTQVSSGQPSITFGPAQGPMGHSILQAPNAVGYYGPSTGGHSILQAPDAVGYHGPSNEITMQPRGMDESSSSRNPDVASSVAGKDPFMHIRRSF